MWFKKNQPKPIAEPGVAMGVQPAMNDMAKSSVNPRWAKRGGFVGLNCFAPFGKGTEQTAKNVPTKEKLEQDWRSYDMPAPTLAKHLEAYLAAAEPRTLERTQRAQTQAPQLTEATPASQATEALQALQSLQEKRELARERIEQKQAVLLRGRQRIARVERVLAESAQQLAQMSRALKFANRDVAANRPALKEAEKRYGQALIAARGEAVGQATQALARLFPQPAARASLAEAFQQAVPEARDMLGAAIEGEALLRAIVTASQRVAVDQPDGSALGALQDVLQQQPASSRTNVTDLFARNDALIMLSKAGKQLGALKSLEQQLSRSVAPGSQAGQPIELAAGVDQPSLAQLQAQASEIIALSPARAHRLEEQMRTIREQQEAEVTSQRFRKAGLRQAEQALQQETQALELLDAQVAAGRSRYEGLRAAALTSAIEQFFDAYTDVKGLDDDLARAKSTARILPEFARALELPAEYLEAGQTEERALAIADALSNNRSQKLDKLSSVLDVLAGQPGGSGAGQDLQSLREALDSARSELPDFVEEGKARLKQDLTAKVARAILADRASTLPGLPPTPEEAQAWTSQAAQLKEVALHYAKLAADIQAALPVATERVRAQQAASMQELVAHLPGAPDAPVALRERIAGHLQRIASHQMANSQPTKDAPLAPMQLTHVVQLAALASEGSAVRMEHLLDQLANQSAAELLRAHITPGVSPDADQARLWRLAAAETVEVTTSLLSANALANKGVDWRDVQYFWRCAEEHERQGETPEARAHQTRLAAAMEGLAMEVGGEPTAAGSPQQRYANMARSAVWKLDTYNAVNEHLDSLRQPGVIVTKAQAGMVLSMQDAKGNGHPATEARQQIASAIGKLREMAAASDVGTSESASQRLATGHMISAIADYLSNRRGSESVWQGIKRGVTRSAQTFQSGAEMWSNELRARDKQRILASYRESYAGSSGQPPEQAPALAGFSRVQNLQTRDGAMSLLKEALEAGAAMAGVPAAEVLKDAGIDSIEAKLALLQDGSVDSPEALRRYLHNVVERTELGDRMDTVSGKVLPYSVPVRIPLGVASLTLGTNGYTGKGRVLNVQANNDSLIMVIGQSKEFSQTVAGGVAIGLDSGVVGLLGPGAALRKGIKTRDDYTLVIKCPIIPMGGLRDLGLVKQQMKDIADVIVDFEQLKDAEGQAYSSPYEAIMDRVKPQPTIDVEYRDVETLTNDVAGQLGLKVAPPFTDAVGAGIGIGATTGRAHTVLHSQNQQGAYEIYDTTKHPFGVSGFVGVTTQKVGAKEHAYAPTGLAASGFVSGLWGGAEKKVKRPVGDDRYVAMKEEYGRYDRNIGDMIETMNSVFPQVARRVQDVAKGFPGLNEADRVRMEFEIMMDFSRGLMRDEADRFSAKLESGQQWMRRGLIEGQSLAEKAGDHELAAGLAEVMNKLTDGDKDQAVKYFVAVGELMESRTSFLGKKATGSSWKEIPVPDTRTKALGRLADLVASQRDRPVLKDWEERVRDGAHLGQR